MAFGSHDVLYVPAGVAHRFVDDKPEFRSWGVCNGPEGGEGGA